MPALKIGKNLRENPLSGHVYATIMMLDYAAIALRHTPHW